jgi:hypothetical protein
VRAKTIKHVWLYWFPDTTPLARKRKVGVFEGQIKRMFAPYHAEMHPSCLAEVSEAQLAALLDSITMRVDKTGNEKATGAALGARTSVATVDRQKTKGFLPTGTGELLSYRVCALCRVITATQVLLAHNCMWCSLSIDCDVLDQ